MKFLNRRLYENKLRKKNIKVYLKYFYLNFFLFYRIFQLKKNCYVYLSNFLFSNVITNFENKKNFKNLNLLFSFNLKYGKFISNHIQINNAFKLIFDLLINSANNLHLLEYKYLKEFLYNFCKYKNYNNYIFILNWVLLFIHPIFYIDCTVVPKKYKKKLKKKYLYKIKYTNKNKRLSKSLRFINNYSNTLTYFKFKDRLFFTYLDLILNYKNSYIYNKKITIYKKIFKV